MPGPARDEPQPDSEKDPQWGADPAASFARAVLEAASSTEHAERELLKEILDAARSGDCSRIERIALCWADMPALDALTAIRSAESCES